MGIRYLFVGVGFEEPKDLTKCDQLGNYRYLNNNNKNPLTKEAVEN